MIPVSEIEYKEELESLREVLQSISKGSDMVVTLRKEASYKEDGEDRTKTVDMQQIVVSSEIERPEVSVKMNGDFLYLFVKVLRKEVLYNIRKLWEDLLDKSTSEMLNDEKTEYLLCIDSVKIDEGLNRAWLLSLQNPVWFMVDEVNKEARIVFWLSNAAFDITDVDMVSVISELDYEEAEKAAADRTAEKGEYDSYDAIDTFTNNVLK